MSLKESLLDILFPPRCAFCRRLLRRGESGMCGRCAASLPEIFARYGIGEIEVIQLSVSRLTSKHTFAAEPAPWLISGKA